MSNERVERIVRNDVIMCVSSLMNDIGQNLERASNVFDFDYDEAIGWFNVDDYREPVDEFIRDDADLDQLEQIAGMVGDWDAALLEIGYDVDAPPQRPESVDKVCVECHMELQGCGYEDQIEERQKEVAEAVAEFQGEYLNDSEYDDEFNTARCACCQTYSVGARFGYLDGSMEDIDLEDWLALEENKGKEKLLRKTVVALITNDDEYREIANEFVIEPHTHEVYEHWVVTPWLGRRLAAQGEVVFDFANMTIWGRCCTGQSISMDGVMERIAEELK